MDEQPPPLPLSATYKPPSLWRQSINEPPASVDRPDEVGFGGALILFFFTVAVATLSLAASLAINARYYFTPAIWQALTTPDSPAYNSFWPNLIYYRLIGKTILLVASFALGWLIFARKKAFRVYAIGYVAVSLVYMLIEYLLGGYIPAVSGHYGPLTVRFLFFKVAYAIFWVTYLPNSHRVRNTFIN